MKSEMKVVLWPLFVSAALSPSSCINRPEFFLNFFSSASIPVELFLVILGVLLVLALAGLWSSSFLFHCFFLVANLCFCFLFASFLRLNSLRHTLLSWVCLLLEVLVFLHKQGS